MSADKNLVYLHHILECIEVIQTYIYEGREDFLKIF